MDNQRNHWQDRFQFWVGAFDCLVINDGSISGNAEMLFVNAPVQQLAKIFHAHALDPNHLPSKWSYLLVKTADHVDLLGSAHEQDMKVIVNNNVGMVYDGCFEGGSLQRC